MAAVIRLAALLTAPLLSYIALSTQLHWLSALVVLLLLTALLANHLHKPAALLLIAAVAVLLVKMPPVSLFLSACFPALFMAMIASLFARSLLPGKTPLIAGMAAAIRDEVLPQKIADYCRFVTWLWAIALFLLAALNVAVLLVPGLKGWATTVSIVGYVSVAGLFVMEFIVRGLWLHEFEHPSAMNFLRGMRRLDFRELLR